MTAVFHPAAVASRAPDRPAYVIAETGQTVTYGQLDRESNRLAHLFRRLGLGRGDHLAMCMDNHVQFLQVAWAAQRAGLYWTPISTKLTAEEAAYIVDDCDARVVITSAALTDVAVGMMPLTPRVEHRLMVGGCAVGHQPLEEAAAQCPTTPIADEAEGVDMLYSSGTTGRPKGIRVPLPVGPVGQLSGVPMLAHRLFGCGEDTVYLSPAPLYHGAPLRFSMAMHRLGGSVVVMQKFDPERALAAIETYAVTHSQWVPTMFVRMLKLARDVRARHDLSSMRVAIHAAAPCPRAVKEEMVQWWGPILHEYYGGTEGNGFVYCPPADWLARPGTVGRLIAGTLHVCDDAGVELSPGEIGTIWFEGTPTFDYHKDPEQTAAARHPAGAGWTTLGDVGYVDADGYLYLTDRRGFTIVSGGVNIYPQETEDVLVMHPLVADVAVFGVPSEDFGEEVKAVVQPVDGVAPTAALADELIAYCRDHLSHVKCPRSLDFVDELPRTPTGKLLKAALRDRYWAARSTRIGN